MKVFDYLEKVKSEKGAGFLLLIDPDKFEISESEEFFSICNRSGVDAFLIGGSLVKDDFISQIIVEIKKFSEIPVILFPGGLNQVTGEADAILFLSLISGRNPEHLIGKHVLAAPLINRINLETIATGYMLIESGASTTAEYMNGTKPIPYNKTEIAVATALAGQYLGLQMIYLEAGSGAEHTVPDRMVRAVTKTLDIPVIVGGGIRSGEAAQRKVEAGADFVVVGNFFEYKDNWGEIKEFAKVIHNTGKRKSK